MHRLGSLLCLLSATFILFVFAADGAAATEKNQVTDDGVMRIVPNNPEDLAKEKAEETEYIGATFENLSKLYWALGMLSPDDNEALDNYLLINECEMYRRYFLNDMDWNNIRNVTRDFLTKNAVTFPTTFEIVTTIKLGRYDLQHEQFEIEEESKMYGTRNIDTQINSKTRLCGDLGTTEIPGYPRNVVLYLNKPIVLTALPVPAPLAEAYLGEEDNTKAAHSHQSYEFAKFNRFAYLRLKVRIIQFKEMVIIVGGLSKAGMFAQVEGLEVYADNDLSQLLYDDHSYARGRQRTPRYKLDLDGRESADNSGEHKEKVESPPLEEDEREEEDEEPEEEIKKQEDGDYQGLLNSPEILDDGKEKKDGGS